MGLELNMATLQIVLACRNNVEAQYVEMMVPLYSYGCEKKVKKTLSHLKGIYLKARLSLRNNIVKGQEYLIMIIYD